MIYYLSLGSNLGDRSGNLARARALLERSGLKLKELSSIYETQPVGFKEQGWFLNQVVGANSPLDPHSLLDVVRRVEDMMGRKQTARNRPRVIDIDILLAEQNVVRSDRLEIPHPRMALRHFVLVPLEEIAPHVVHPVLNKTVEQLARECEDDSRVVKLRAGMER